MPANPNEAGHTSRAQRLASEGVSGLAEKKL